jgi:hypothetical protein
MRRRFDQVATLLAMHQSPRRLGRRLATAGALGSLSTRGKVGEVAAGCVKLGEKCKRDDRCCAGECKNGKCRCTRNRHCDTGQRCVKRRCVTGRGTCPIGTDSCVGPSTGCNGNPNCFCYATVGGATRCGEFAGNCGGCADDGDCAPLGVGAFCVKTTAACCHPSLGTTICAVPCPT